MSVIVNEANGAGPLPESADSADSAALIGLLEQGRSRFLALVEPIRPELHRYCTRMTGSIADGEDVVQETLARACFELPQMTALPPLRPWLFRIAHNRAIDHWRHEQLRASEPIDSAAEFADEAGHEPDHQLARKQAVQAAIACFLGLAPAQRGCVILADVLEHSVDEIAHELGLSVPAVKSALHRGREALRLLTESQPPSPPPRAPSQALLQYARLFNAHDWDGVRALLADDVRLDLVSRRKAAGRRAVGNYLDNYERSPGWRMGPAWFDGHEGLAVLDAAGAPATLIEIGFAEGRVVLIRDFRYVRYIAQDGAVQLFPTDEGP